MSYVAGPSIGGLLVRLLTAPVALLVDAVSFLVSAALPRPDPPVEPPAEQAERATRRAGCASSPARRSCVRRSGPPRRSTSSTSCSSRSSSSTSPASSASRRACSGGARRRRGRRPDRVGRHRPGRTADRHRPDLVLGCVRLPGAASARAARRRASPVVLALLFLAEFGSGLGVMMLDISAGAISPALIPDRLRSRVSGAYMAVNYGVRPLGALWAARSAPRSGSDRRCGSPRSARCSAAVADRLADPAPARPTGGRGLTPAESDAGVTPFMGFALHAPEVQPRRGTTR